MLMKLILSGLALSAQAPASAQSDAARPAPQPITQEESEMVDQAEHNIAVVKKMIAAWEARDGDAIAEMFTEDGILHSMMIEPIVGREEIRPRMAFIVDNSTHMHLNVRTWAVTGNTVFIEREDEFVFKGRAGKVPVVGVLVVEGDKIKEWREYYDRAELLEEMGIEGDF